MSENYQITTITVTFECTQYAVKGLTELLRAMAMCHANGMSRDLIYDCDGDGQSPRITDIVLDGSLINLTDLPESDDFRRIIQP